VGVDEEKHGFLPGTLEQKMEPWIRPLIDVLREYYSIKDITPMMIEQIIEVSPLAFMRGRTFKDSWIIGDEMQNATPGQVKMLLTRIGENSKIIITGDVDQADRQGKNNGLLDLKVRLETNLAIKKLDNLSLCEFTNLDIQRHHIITDILNLYNTEV
jgi:phosphate starvation-inducible PhoH-like protein